LKWLKENGCPWSEDLCMKIAVSSGNLEKLKWMKEVGCPLNMSACREAARHGNLEVLKWLSENGCAWGARVGILLATRGNNE